MYSLSRFALRRNLLPCIEVLKPFNSLLRFQKTEAVSDRSGDQESATQGKPFQDIPGRPKNFKSFVEFYWKSERFTKGYKCWTNCFGHMALFLRSSLSWGRTPCISLILLIKKKLYVPKENIPPE